VKEHTKINYNCDNFLLQTTNMLNDAATLTNSEHSRNLQWTIVTTAQCNSPVQVLALLHVSMHVCVCTRAIVDLITHISVTAMLGFGSKFMDLNNHDQCRTAVPLKIHTNKQNTSTDVER
jgi:hypothetical protein